MTVLITIWDKFVGGLSEAVLTLWNSIKEVIPGLIGAVIIFIIGWFVAKIVKQIVVKVLQSTKVDQWLDEQNLTAAIGGKEISVLLGSFTRWYILIIFLGQAASLIRLDFLQKFIDNLVLYIPQVLAALLVMILVLLLGRYAKNAIETTQHGLKKIAGVAVEVVIVLLGSVIATTLALGKDTGLIYLNTLKTFIDPFLWAAAIAVGIMVGLSVGLAFKEEIKKFVLEVKKSFK